jgi:hypothetical protein
VRNRPFPRATTGAYCTLTEATIVLEGRHNSFDAWLPGLTTSIRIDSLEDAKIFARRWVIRNKDPALKALVRRLDKARGSEAAASALGALHQALASRNLLSPPGAA